MQFPQVIRRRMNAQWVHFSNSGLSDSWNHQLELYPSGDGRNGGETSAGVGNRVQQTVGSRHAVHGGRRPRSFRLHWTPWAAPSRRPANLARPDCRICHPERLCRLSVGHGRGRGGGCRPVLARHAPGGIVNVSLNSSGVDGYSGSFHPHIGVCRVGVHIRTAGQLGHNLAPCQVLPRGVPLSFRQVLFREGLRRLPPRGVLGLFWQQLPPATWTLVGRLAEQPVEGLRRQVSYAGALLLHQAERADDCVLVRVQRPDVELLRCRVELPPQVLGVRRLRVDRAVPVEFVTHIEGVGGEVHDVVQPDAGLRPYGNQRCHGQVSRAPRVTSDVDEVLHVRVCDEDVFLDGLVCFELAEPVQVKLVT